MKTIITRYGNRYWAVYREEELLVVALYRKGARLVAELLDNLPNQISAPESFDSRPSHQSISDKS